MNKLSDQQIIQENSYEYPYHYIPIWNGITFSQTHTLWWGYEYISYLHYVLDKVSQMDFESLLDVGCGDGRFLFELSRRFSSKRLSGIDYSKRAIDFARIMRGHSG
jgi:methylase of polypeptide subunit release factors